jgi:hypothetical protein
MEERGKVMLGPRTLALVVALLAALCALPATAVAAVSPSYTVSGVEVAATTTQGTFVGTAQGSTGDSAAWKAVVQHQELRSSCWTTGCTITPGGSLSVVNDQLSTITGSFTGGSVTLISGASGCGIQTFHVVGNAATSVGARTFDVILTHYRVSIFGSCISYFATVSGTLRAPA